MFLKVTCLVVSSISYHHCIVPPPASKTVSGDTDKIHKEGWANYSLLTWLPYVLAYSHNLGTLIYVLTTLRGGSIDAFDVRELETLESWQVALAVIALVGHAFRVWAIQSLARFFTVSLPQIFSFSFFMFFACCINIACLIVLLTSA